MARLRHSSYFLEDFGALAGQSANKDYVCLFYYRFVVKHGFNAEFLLEGP